MDKSDIDRIDKNEGDLLLGICARAASYSSPSRGTVDGIGALETVPKVTGILPLAVFKSMVTI